MDSPTVVEERFRLSNLDSLVPLAREAVEERQERAAEWASRRCVVAGVIEDLLEELDRQSEQWRSLREELTGEVSGRSGNEGAARRDSPVLQGR